MTRQDNVEEIFPLSPLQTGIFMHALESAGSGLYFEQYCARLTGHFDPETYRQAWEQVVQRHGVLRTSFVWEGLPSPFQVVERSVALPWVELDWRAHDETEQKARLDAYLAEDIARGFDLAQGPLLRLAVIRMGAEERVAVLGIHHIVMDGWSGGIVMAEASAIHHALAKGQAVSLPPAPSYRRYVDWIASRDDTAARDYWSRQLAGFDAPSVLPMDRAPFRASGAASGHGWRETCLGRGASDALTSFAATAGVTVNSVLQAAWALLLARYCGQDDILFGTTCATRPGAIEGIERMVGLLLNTLPVRLRVDQGVSAAAWVRRVQDVLVEARAHDHVALASLRSFTELRDGQPLFETLTVFENYPAPPSAKGSGNLTVEPLEGFEKTSYPLNLLGFPGAEIRLRILHDPKRFSGPAVEALLRHLTTLLAAFAACPDRLLADMDLLQEDERNAILGWSRGPASPAPPPGGLLERVDSVAASQPLAMAAADESGELTYADLIRHSFTLAARLKEAGVEAGDIVGLHMAPCRLWPASVLAVLRVGGAWMPLDTAYPADRLAHMIEDSGCGVVLADQDTPPPGFTGTMIRIDAVALPEQGQTDVVWDYPAPETPSYVIFTSGSTGRPKGVINSHAGLANLMRALERDLSPDGGIRVLQFASFNFDASVLELVLALCRGGSLHLAERAAMADPARLTALIAGRRITHALIPPVMLRLLEPAAVPDFHSVIVGGDVCPADLAAQWSADRRFFNFYGPTEAAVYATSAAYVDGRTERGIGRPVANCQVLVLDSAGRLCPAGVPGEIHILGASLSQGYLKRPEETAARFVQLPEGPAYRTGDLATWDTDGYLQYRGRVDSQVKIRGFRIELSEVEAALKRIETVEDSVVLAVGETTERRLVGFAKPVENRCKQEAERQTARWRQTYDEIYGAIAAAPLHPSQNFEGWTTSYDDKAIPTEEMKRWANASAERLAVLAPRRVLEIGCGQGLLLFRLIDACDSYVAADFSAAALECIRQRAGDARNAKLTLVEGEATELDLGAEGSFDLVILNSVVQYFPDETHLRKALDRVVPHIAPGGAMFLGDLRDLALWEAHHAAIQWHRAGPGLSAGAFLERMQARLRTESELLVHPGFVDRYCRGLERKTWRATLAKGGDYDNELSQFRFDAMIRFDREAEDSEAAAVVDLTPADLAPRRLSDLLATTGSPLVIGRGLRRGTAVFSSRLAEAAAADPEVDLAGLAQGLGRPGDLGTTPAGIVRAAQDAGWHCDVHVPKSGDPAQLLAVFTRSHGTPTPLPCSVAGTAEKGLALCNIPTPGGAFLDLEADLKQGLSETLPPYMIPSRIHVLPRWPVTPSGKIDRAALDLLANSAPSPSAKGRTPPTTPREIALAALWAEILGTTAIQSDDDFFALGGHSILAAQLANRIRADLKPGFHTGQIYDHPVLSDLAARIDDDRIDKRSRDLGAETLLPPRICAGATLPEEHPDRALLTGATGFVGSHLLAALRADRRTRVVCLVRAHDPARAFDRLTAAFVANGLDTTVLQEGVEVVPGDLEAPELGLDTARRRLVQEDCGAIYHCGAHVDFLHPYDSLKAANVDSLVTLLDWTARGRGKSLHHVSTMGVIDHRAAREPVDEADPLESWQGLEGGYNQSKWVADSLARRAQARGLAVSVYRLASVTGSHGAAICNRTDLIWRLAQAYALLQSRPDLDMALDLTPADDVAASLVALSRRRQNWGRTFHLASDSPVSWNDIAAAMARQGMPLERLPAADWLKLAQARLEKGGDASGDANLAVVLPILSGEAAPSMRRILHEASRKAMAAAGRGITGVDAPLLERYIARLRDQGGSDQGENPGRTAHRAARP